MTYRTNAEAEAIVGTLGRPSKMPGYAYGIPAKYCPVGKILVNIKGSVCSNCYALKGRYVFPNVLAAQQRRFNSLTDPRWVSAMTYLIRKKASRNYFRWHDSGDLQGMWHLENIVQVAVNCPTTKFWLPTRETALIREYYRKYGAFPKNLVVRVSGAMLDGKNPDFPHTSSVVTDDSASCPSRFTGGRCADCRACWDRRVSHVSYQAH